MFKKIKEFFVGKPAPAPVVETAPYKVPQPAATTPIPLVVEEAKVGHDQGGSYTIEQVVEEAKSDVKIVEATVELSPTASVATSVTVEAPVKKPRKPRAPKAVAEKPAVKKAASKKAAPKDKSKKS